MMDDESSVAPEFFSCSRKACNGKQLRFHQRDLVAYQTLFRRFGFNPTLGGGADFSPFTFGKPQSLQEMPHIHMML
jgi:hypothetical protein